MFSSLRRGGAGVTGLAAVLAFPLLVWSASAASADGDFGSNPYVAVQRAASSVTGNSSLNTCGMTSAQLTAALIAPTYNESGNQTQTFAPSPGALGREDKNWPNLYVSDNAYKFSDDPRRRVDWMPGTGLWQADDGGFGRPYSTEKLTASGLAVPVARYLIGQYCSNGGSVAAMFDMGMWSGCAQTLHSSAGDCVYYYNQLYNSATGTLQAINKPAMSDGAGTKKRQCQIGNSQAAQTFDCYLVTPGTTTTEHCPPNMCGKSPTAGLALSAPFYVWRAKDSSGYVEARYWPPSSTGGPAYVAKRRYYANNPTQPMRPMQSRDVRLLKSVAPNMQLCDFTIGGPNCPAVPTCRAGNPC